jgi:hypothetical protein
LHVVSTVHRSRPFTVTHPFHPLGGQQFEALVVRNNWGEDRVSYLGPDGGVRSLPIAWTDLAAVDPVVTVAAGRALFRLEDLLALCAVVRRAPGSAAEGGV